MGDPRIEAALVDANNLLVATTDQHQHPHLGFDFFGSVVTLDQLADVSQKTVYLTGDISKLRGRELAGAARVLVVKQLSHGYDDTRALRRLYAEENKTDAFIDYGDKFRFSMNEGDYRAPDQKRG